MTSSKNEHITPHQNEQRQLIAGRRRARRLALQALYAMALSERTATEVSAEFESQQDFGKADTAYFRRLVLGVEHYRVELDDALTPFLDRAVSVLTPIELAILRMAMFELQHQVDVPFKAVINEAVNLATKFGADQSFKYVNGVLDKAARCVRVHEQPKPPQPV
ncbi:MAG: transcription antitermination factor NusB [Gammaproteobacteria bacterium]